MLAPMPGQTGTFSTNARGYYFIAPTCFTLTGAEVPTTASSGNQSIAIVRFQTTPPTYSVTTNTFEILYLTQNNPSAGILAMNIPINQGDIIGVLGCRSDVSSYSNTGNVTSFNGFPATLSRLGMQFPLSSTVPQQLWTEAATNISRVFLYYDSSMVYYMNVNNVGADYTFSVITDTLYTNATYTWDFGDGSPMYTGYQPTHTYTTNGNHNVCAYITTSCGTDTICTSVNVCLFAASAGFSNSITGLDLTLTDGSTNATSWQWYFGDGDSSTLQNPTHTYAANGWYDITQIVSNTCGPNDTIIDSVLICIPATANFSSSTTGFDVNFTDASMYTTSWNWDFGDGNTSTSQNPSHTYASMGWYTVTLISSNFCGPNDTIIDSVLICTPPISGTFVGSNLNSTTASFTDGSTDATSWMWDFGDGNTSTSQNPTNNYATNGNYNVCEIVTNLCGADTTCISVTVCPSDPTSGFISLSAVFSATFTNTSTSATTYLWNFGDGNTSTLASPNHTYATAGSYNVCLTSFDECGDSSVFCAMITIPGNVGLEEISEQHSLNSYPNPTTGTSNVSVQSPENIEGKLYVTDMTGKVVNMIHAGLFQKGEAKFPINVSEWNSGIYILVWETEHWKASKKLIVQ